MRTGTIRVASLSAGLVVAGVVLTGTYWYLVQAVVGGVFAVVGIASPRVALLLWVLVSPHLRTYGRVAFPVGLPDLTFDRVTVAVVCIAVLLGWQLSGRRLASAGGVEKLMALLVVVVAVDVAMRGQNRPSEALEVFDELIAPFLLYAAGRNLLGSPRDPRAIVLVMAGLGTVLSLHGVYQYLTHSLPDFTTTPEQATGHLAEGRAVGPFSNGVEYGAVVAATLLWTLYVGGATRRGLTRLGVLVLASLMAVATVMSLTRSVWVGLAGAILTLAALDRRRRRTILVGLVLAAVLTAVAMLAFSDHTRIGERTSALVPVYERLVMYRVALRMAVARPFLGYGRGEREFVMKRKDYLASVGSIDAEFGDRAGPPHDVYLYVLVQWGLAGLIPYIGILALLVRSARDLRRRLPREDGFVLLAANAFAATSCLYLLQGVFVDVSAFTYLSSLYFLLAGQIQALLDRSAPAGAAESLASRSQIGGLGTGAARRQ